MHVMLILLLLLILCRLYFFTDWEIQGKVSFPIDFLVVKNIKSKCIFHLCLHIKFPGMGGVPSSVKANSRM